MVSYSIDRETKLDTCRREEEHSSLHALSLRELSQVYIVVSSPYRTKASAASFIESSVQESQEPQVANPRAHQDHLEPAHQELLQRRTQTRGGCVKWNA